MSKSKNPKIYYKKKYLNVKNIPVLQWRDISQISL